MASKSVIKHVSVFGSGLMGSGIAQVTAAAGYQVTLFDQSDSILNKAVSSIKTSLQRTVKKKFESEPAKGAQFIDEIMSRIKTSTSVPSTSLETDLVIEAIVENLEAKHSLFRPLDKITPATTLFASNTSSLSIGDIAQAVERKDKFGGLHFFNPVPVMKLLEVVRTSKTSAQTHQELLDFGKSIGKVTIECKDTPGFIVNRLLIPYNFEAIKMYERGDASMKDIDTAMKLGAGYPMGPFELSDYVGLDTSKFIADGWAEKFPNEFGGLKSELVEKLVSEKKLGRKTGEGFYKYADSKPKPKV